MADPLFETMEAAFAEIKRRGLMVNNLMQMDHDLFRASLRADLHPGLYSGFSDAPTPLGALNKVVSEHGLFRDWHGYKEPKAAKAFSQNTRELLGLGEPPPVVRRKLL